MIYKGSNSKLKEKREKKFNSDSHKTTQVINTKIKTTKVPLQLNNKVIDRSNKPHAKPVTNNSANKTINISKNVPKRKIRS